MNLKYEELNLEIYPNSSTDEITINWEADQQALSIDIYDVFGELVFSKTVNNAEGSITFTKEELNLSAGTYIIKNKQGNSISQNKIIIL